LDRFAEVVIHTSLKATLSIFGSSARGQGNNGSAADASFLFAKLASGLVSIHLGHLTIHNDDVIPYSPASLQDFPAIGNRICSEA
jgi:hypothetical protein